MDCPSCGRGHRPGARFCGGCGASLAPRCPACGETSAGDARFCEACGAPLSGRRPSEKGIARKLVTVVFADLIGSVSLHERLDAESARRLIDRYHRAMTAAVDAHGGKVVQLLGDGVLAAFGVPRVAEDDAIRAVRAAVAMQRAFRELGAELGAPLEGVGLRVAVNTGELVVSDDETAVIGDPTNVAARLQQEARDGDVIVGEGTQRLVADLATLAPLGSFALRGRRETVAAYRVVSLERPAGVRTAAFVGRDEELRRLLAVYDAAVAAPGARLALLLGSPGLGKSRLLAELGQRVGARASVLAARCDATGGTTFAPLAEALRAFLRVEEGAGGDALRAAVEAVLAGDEPERARIAAGVAALLSGAPGSPEETFFAVRRLLAALAAVRPVVLAIDDLHWAEPLLLDLVEHLVQWSAGAPLLVLAAARPELRDARSSLAAPGPLVTDVVTLGGLDAGASTRLAASLVGASELPAALVGRVLATSEGNPLFLAELVRMLVQDGTLRREGDRWVTTVAVSELDMPPTLQVLLAARIERLRPEERSVLERAAVVGRHFSRSAVAHLLAAGAPDVDAPLEALRRSELIEPDSGWFLGEPALRFHHALIRDAAYRRILKQTRAELHERLADWVAARSGDAGEHEETIGFHLEHAHRNRLELGPLDAHGRSLGERAARHLGAAGRRALARDDVALAASLLGRAVARLDREDPARADLALDWCEALLSAGEVSAASHAVGELARFAGASERLRAWHACFAGQLAALTDPRSLRDTADAVAAAADALAAAGDAAGEAKAHSVRAGALARLGAIGACEAALDLALAAARRARDRRRANAVLAGAPVAALWGPSPVTQASGRCLDVVRVLRITQGAPAVEAVALRCQAVLEALRGRGDAARRMIASSRSTVEELGIAQQLLETDVFAGLIELLEGHPTSAERPLRGAYEGLRERGLRIDAARAAALLGRALLGQDRAAEAEALSHESEALAGDDLKAAIAWRGVRAEALARRGEHGPAVELARAAVALASATDALLDHADARVALAAALRAAGALAEADAEQARAIELWEAKGATMLSKRARGGVARAGPAAVALAAGERTDPARRAHRRVRENDATASVARLRAAGLARDDAAIAALCADGLQVLHRPTGAQIDGARGLERFRTMGPSDGLAVSLEIVATLGDSLALVRDATSFDRPSPDGLSFGASRQLALVETNAGGQPVRVEIFAEDHLAEAVVRLYERHGELLPAGPARERAEAVARTAAALLGTADLERWAAVLAPGIEFTDPRNVGRGTVVFGAEPLLRSVRVLMELSDDFGIRVDDVLALRADALLVRWTTHGRDRAGGGDFERNLCHLWVFGADGRVARWEQSDGDAAEEALARFDTLAAPPESSFENAAARSFRDFARCWNARDWEGIVAAHAPDARLSDRRPLTGVDLEGREFFATMRLIFDLRAARWHGELLGTRGDRLALFRRRLEIGDEAKGISEAEYLGIVEVDAAGRTTADVVLDPGDLDTAYAELDARYHAGEGAAHPEVAASMRAFSDALARRDWDALASCCAADLGVRDHRRLGWETLRGPDGYVAALRALVELAPDARMRLDHVEMTRRGFLVRTVWVGTRDGGSFEEPSWMVGELDAAGRIRRLDQYDPERRDAARARFAELAQSEPGERGIPVSELRGGRGAFDPPSIPPNPAWRVWDRIVPILEAQDWPALRALAAPDFAFEDRRRFTLVRGDVEVYVRNLEFVRAWPGRRVERELVATAGDRLALDRIAFVGDPQGGSFEGEFLRLTELDSEGRLRAVLHFDPGDRLAAHDEMGQRHARGGT
jgi:class 3 adenylate cyclase